jgi:LPXTG-motif cell wall-anchored protein
MEAEAEDGTWSTKTVPKLEKGAVIRAISTDKFGGVSEEASIVVDKDIENETTEIPPIVETKPVLPVTGQNVDVIMLASVLVMLFGTLTLFGTRKKLR